MSAITAQEGRELSIGRVLARAFDTIRGNAATMVGIALLFGAIPYSLEIYVVSVFVPDARDPTYFLSAQGGAVVASEFLFEVAVATLVLGPIIQATLVYAEGRRASLGECLRVAASAFVPLLALNLLFILGLIVGFVFLIIPGLLMWCIWFVAKPALIAERIGIIAAFRRSKQLTDFQGWKMLGLLTMLVGTGAVLNQLVKLILRALEGPGPAAIHPGSYILLVPVSTLSYLLWPTVQASAYIELRNAKEGPMVHHLEQVFA